MVDIQNITTEHTKRGVSQEHVFKTIVYPTYRISRRTYYSYLSTPAKMDLKKMQAIDQLQASLF